MSGASTTISPLRRGEIIEALRIGAVPPRGQELFAVGMERFESAIDEELESVAAGRGRFKAVRGEYGTGKTFFSRWLEHRAREQGFATTLVQISETETPLYKMQTIYRRAIESLETREWGDGAFASLIDRWLYSLEDEVISEGRGTPDRPEQFAKAVGDLLEKRLADVSRTQPQFAAVLRACYSARIAEDHATEQGLIAWLMGQPNVAAAVKRTAGIKGDLDNDAAAGFFRGLLEILKQTGRKGLVLVLDEVETIQRVKSDSREKSLNALRTLIDEVHLGRYPGLYILITGTPAFYDGPRGVKSLAALAQRMGEFDENDKFASTRAVQIGLTPFNIDRMTQVGVRIRDVYASGKSERILTTVTDDVVRGLADKVAGKLGGRVGIAPRIFLKRLIDMLDKVDEFEDFDPTRDFNLVINASEMTAEEAAAAGVERSVDDIELDLGEGGTDG